MRLSAWRSVGNDGEPYPDFIRECIGWDGVYAIRDRWEHVVYYVGESHSGRLYETLTRHLQRWAGDFVRAYHRGSVEVAIAKTSDPDAVRSFQRRLIDELEPADNIYGAGEDEDVPF